MSLVLFPQPDWVEHLQTAILLLDAEDRVRFLNPAAEDLLGVTASHAGVALSRELRASGLGELVARASREQRALSAQDIEWQDAGRVQWLDVQVTALHIETLEQCTSAVTNNLGAYEMRCPILPGP